MKDTLTLERELLTTRALLARQEVNVTALLARIDELENLYHKSLEAYAEERKEHEAALETEEKRRWALEDENNELQARVAELEAERDTLNRGVQYWQNVANTNDKKAALCWELEQRSKEQEEAIKELVKGWDEWKEENTELKARIAELEVERDALKEEVERCEACIRFWKKGACDLLQEQEER